MRQEFPTKVKAAAFLRAAGCCEVCTRRLATGDVRYDHINPDGLTGEPTLANCQVLCRSCHDLKTRTEDVPAIARAKRREARHIGAKPKSRNPLPCGRASPWRKKMNGEVVRR